MVVCIRVIYGKKKEINESLKIFLDVVMINICIWIRYVYDGGESEKECVFNYFLVFGMRDWKKGGNIYILVKIVIVY